jgi:CheY-like chemotaxis protein
LKSRRDSCHIPIILLTALASEEKQIKGLKVGADDYISKPFDLEEFLLRVKNIVKRSSKEFKKETDTYQFGVNSTFNLKTLIATNNFEEIQDRMAGIDSDINSLRQPSTFKVDLRYDKTFKLNLGSRSVDMNVYVDVRNLFNAENVRDVWRNTGLPGTDGFLESPESSNDILVNNEYKKDVYRYLLNNPDKWGTPRTIRLGLRVNL